MKGPKASIKVWIFFLLFGKTEQEYSTNLHELLERFVEYGVTQNTDKCVFYAKEVQFLGHLKAHNHLLVKF